MTSPARPPRPPLRIVLGVAAVVVAAAAGLAIALRQGDDAGETAAPGAPGTSTATAASPAPGATSAAVVGTPTTAPPSGAAGSSGPSSPAAPAVVAMPDLVGRNAAAARIALEEVGFHEVRFESQDAAETSVVLPQNWTVTRQSAAAGARVPASTAIVLTCTRRV